MSQEDLLNINENSKLMEEIGEQNNSNLNNDLREREKKFERINGTNNVIIENSETNSKNKNETANNNEFQNNDAPKDLINTRDKSPSGLFITNDNQVENKIQENSVRQNNHKNNSINEINASTIVGDKSPNSNLNNSDFNLNNTNIDDDIMTKINQEAQKFENNVISGEDIYDKYEKVTEQQFKDMVKDKNKQILDLSENQETYKKELSKIIDQLNDAFDKFTFTSNKEKKEKNGHLQYKLLEQQIAAKAKELINVKNQLKLYQKQYDLVNSKANDKFTTEKISEMEEQIARVRKDNIEQSNKLKKLKNMQYTQGKELETNNLLKKFPNQINAYTDEIKNLVSKKQEHFSKISNNKKSLLNLKNILINIQKNYEKITTSKAFQKSADSLALMNSIEESINLLQKDLNMPEEELIEKINNLQTVNKYTFISNQGSSSLSLLNAPKALKSKTIGQDNSEVFSKRISPSKNFKRNIYNNYYGKAGNDNKLIGFNVRNKSPQLSLPQILPPIINKANKERSSSPYKGIFNKYEYLASKDKVGGANGPTAVKDGKKVLSAFRKNYAISSANKLSKKEANSSSNRNGSLDEKIMDSGDELRNNISDENLNLNLDYEQTHNIDYHNLQKKEEQLIKINQKLEKNIREIEKLYDKKFHDIQKVIEQNQTKLKIVQQKNELLAVEIADLTKILKLNVEEIKLKREIKDNESKILKSVILNTNDVSQTRTDILNELNTILKEEQNNKNKKEIKEKENIIKEEHGESNNSLMNHDMEENKPIKFPDISNVEHIDDETINPNRANRLTDIKNKYLNENLIENEGEVENDEDNLSLDENNNDNVEAADDKLILETENINP